MLHRILGITLLFSALAAAALVRVELIERSDVLGGMAFGPAGAYERVIAKTHFAVDPTLAANRIITDIGLAPHNENGLVEFSADLYVLKPIDPARGNGTVLYEVSNRGRKGMLGMFNLATGSPLDPREKDQFGDGLLFQQGLTLAWLGWQWDVPRDPHLMRLYAPAAHDGDKPITGLMRAEFVADRKAHSFSLADRTMIAYPVVDPNDRDLRLTVRDRNDGPRRTIPRDRWEFAREENGRPVPDRAHVYVNDGLEPGRIYELVYKARDPLVVGLGPAAVRDFISFLKYGGPNAGITLLGDQRRHLKRAIGFGTSQSGRFLRTFLYYGFNQDEQNRKVFDGVMAHVAGGGRGSFNHRFAQPSRDAHPFMNFFYPTDIFPFADLEQSDPETGLSDGILTRAEKAGVTPKIFYTNSSYEYYGRAASLIHTWIDGKQDAPLAKDTRIYLFAGGQHGPAAFPPRRNETVNLPNPNDFRWSMRALLLAMHRWLADGVEPPPSQYPRVAYDRAVPLGAVQFPKIPGVAFPTRMHHGYRVDYGPRFRTAGIVDFEPPKVGKPFTMLVPQVDFDGNETSGIRMPEIQAPLATYTGWNLRDPKIGAPDEIYSMVGSWIPFARTKAERQQKRDPRPSIEERYKSRDEYLARVKAAAEQLARDRYLLEADVGRLVERGGTQWDYVMAGRASE